MCEDGLQIILSTHSPSFLDILCLSGMHLVYKEETITHVRRHSQKTLAGYCNERGADANKCKEQTVLPFYSANSNEEILKGFFARAVVLVEGPTEALALPIYLAAGGCDTKEKGVAVIPVHGKGSIARYIRLFEAYEIPTYSVFDNDPEDDGNGNKRREIIEAYGYDFDPSLLQFDNINVQERFAVFGKDFETSLRNQFSEFGYEEKEASVKESFGPAKPLAGREVALLLAKGGTADESWEPIKRLASRIGELIEQKANENEPF
jgi:putative ATP-dependent endonuclease of OLD family